MKKIFVSQNLIEVEMRKEHLEQAGIRCMIKNQRSSSLAGEIPFTEVYPELWVIQDEEYDRAQRLLEEGSGVDALKPRLLDLSGMRRAPRGSI